MWQTPGLRRGLGFKFVSIGKSTPALSSPFATIIHHNNTSASIFLSPFINPVQSPVSVLTTVIAALRKD
jgi:hypothetical protein